MSLLDYPSNALPGMGTAVTTTESNFLQNLSGQFELIQGELVSTAVDAGNTPTTTLREGLLLGKITTSGKLKEYNPTGTDGSEVAYGILAKSVKMLNSDGTAVDRLATVVIRGTAANDNSQVLLLDEQARRQLHHRILFLDRLDGVPGGPRKVVAKTADYTVVNGTDNEVMFTNAGAAGAVNFTLPTTLKPGSHFSFFVETDQNVTITAPANSMVVFNDVTATSIAFSTSSEKVGAGVDIYVNAAGTKYLAKVSLGAESQTPTIV